MKLNRIYTRIIVSFLVISLLLSSVSLSSVTVQAESDGSQADFQNEVANQLDATSEAKLDALVPNSAGDWSEKFKENLPWNYFHNAVQRDIRNNNEGMGVRELPIEYKSEDGKTHKGRADIYKRIDDKTYIWEVKPASYRDEPQKSIGLARLENYVKSNENYKFGNTDGTDIKDNEFEYGNYIINYKNMGNGLILYWFKRKPEPSPSPGAVVIAKPKEDADDNMKNSLKNPPAVPDNNVGQAEEDNVAAIVKEAAVCITIATGTIAVHGKIRNTNSVSRTLVTASEGILALLVPFVANPTVASAAEVESKIDDFMDVINAVEGEDAEEAYREAMEEGDKEKADEITDDLQDNADDYDDAANAQPPRDPLIVDLGTEGIELKSLENGVNFDLDNNGFAEKTAWIGEEDGFLAYDRNSNGVIDNGGELFGDQVVMKNGEKSQSGFEALGELDDNQDGVINEEDFVFTKLTIWIDANHNGRTDDNELNDLATTGICSISLDYIKISLVDEETGTRKADTADVSMLVNGEESKTSITEFWFPVDTSSTTDEGTVTVGNIPNIDKALKRDESGQLVTYCNQFFTSDSPASKRYYLKKILYYLTGATNITKNSRGGNIDAQELKVVEQFMGRDFVGVNGSDPNASAASILKSIYENIENQYYCLLNLKGAFGVYVNGILEQKNAQNNKVLDLSFLYYVLDGKISNGDYVNIILYDFGVYLRGFDAANATNYYNDFLAHYAEIDDYYSTAILQAKSGATYMGTSEQDYYKGTSSIDYIYGLESNDTLYGSFGNDIIYGNEGEDYLCGDNGDDSLYGGEGNDRLYGGEGNDTLLGGTGNDNLYGGKGDDTYIYNIGEGNDTISDKDDTVGNTDTLQFGAGITSENVTVKRVGYNLELSINGTEDKVTINSYLTESPSGLTNTYAVENIAFLDGTNWTLEQILDMLQQGTDGNDTLYGYSYIEGRKDDVLHGLEGNDTLYGYLGNDTLYGEEGDDTLYGGNGDDTLSGGEGKDNLYGENGDDILEGGAEADYLNGGEENDVLNGGEGNDSLYGGKGSDIYKINLGDGQDTISDSITTTEEVNVIQFGEGIAADAVSVKRTGENLELTYNGTEDKITVYRYFREYSSGITLPYAMQEIQFADGTVWTPDDILDKVQEATSETDILYGYSYIEGRIDDELHGQEGNDTLYGYLGNDTLYGEEGDDTLYGGNGDDTLSGGEGKDKLYGENGDDILEGGAEADYLNGGEGNDVLNGGEGNDSLYGGKGSDIYKINLGDGQDTISDSITTTEEVNVIQFGEGIAADAVSVKRTGENLELTYNGTEDKITVYRYFSEYSSGITLPYAMQEIQFADGTVWTPDDILDKVQEATSEADILYGYSYIEGRIDDELHGQEGNDTLYGYLGNDTLYGEEGDDTLYGGNGDDTLSGGEGKDKLYGENGDDILEGGTEADYLNGGEGNDVLSGGEGNDSLYGGKGSDIYKINLGDGQDTISDSITTTEEVNVIQFGEGIAADAVSVKRTGENLELTYNGTEDKITVYRYFSEYSSGITLPYAMQEIQFADGTVWTPDDILDKVQEATSETDILYGYSYIEGSVDDELSVEENDALSEYTVGN